MCEQLQAAAETGLGDYLTSRVEEAPASKKVVLRFGHPKAAPAKGVTVNGKPWTEFNKHKETIALKDLTGNVAVTARY